MATVSATPVLTQGEQRVVIRGVGWRGYRELLEMIGDQAVRLTYDRGDVELMSPLLKHERRKSRLGQFVRVLARELRIPVLAAGSTTWAREDLDRGLEADESFYLGDLERVRDPDNVDLEVDPPPDLAIEIEISRSALNRLGVYGALGVPEIWRFDGRTLSVLLRQDDGTYRQSSASAAFPGVPMAEVERFATMDGIRDENACVDLFWSWVRDDLLPRPGSREGT